jgi:Reeler domain
MYGTMSLRWILCALLLVVTQALPTGPGSCNTGNPLGSSHLSSGTSGALSKYGLVLKIGGKVVSPTKAFSVAAGKSLAITLGSSSKTFRGFLMRISHGSTNTSAYLKKSTDANVQVVSLCTSAKVGGIGHNNNSDKKSVSGTLSVPKAGSGLKLEVTVVVQNKGKSIWYKSDFTLNAV